MLRTHAFVSMHKYRRSVNPGIVPYSRRSHIVGDYNAVYYCITNIPDCQAFFLKNFQIVRNSFFREKIWALCRNKARAGRPPGAADYCSRQQQETGARIATAAFGSLAMTDTQGYPVCLGCEGTVSGSKNAPRPSSEGELPFGTVIARARSARGNPRPRSAVNSNSLPSPRTAGNGIFSDQRDD